MAELTRGVWRWFAENGRDLGRIATALERVAEELATIRRELQDVGNREEQK